MRPCEKAGVLDASADVLLTLDRNNFHAILGKTVYGLQILTPGEFLQH